MYITGYDDHVYNMDGISKLFVVYDPFNPSGTDDHPYKIRAEKIDGKETDDPVNIAIFESEAAAYKELYNFLSALEHGKAYYMFNSEYIESDFLHFYYTKEHEAPLSSRI